MSVIDQLTLKSLSKDCTLLPFVLSAMFNEKQLSFTAKGRKSKTIPSDDVSTTMVKMLWRATLVMPFVEVSQSQSEIQSQSETQMRVPTSLPTLGRVPDTLLLALVSLGKSHDDWETTYLYNNGRSLYETLCSAFPSEIEFRTSWKDDVCIARIELDFMRKYNEHRSQDTGAMINRKYGRMLTHPRTYSSNFNTDIILFAMMCRDYLRAGNSALLEGGVTISHMILKQTDDRCV